MNEFQFLAPDGFYRTLPSNMFSEALAQGGVPIEAQPDVNVMSPGGMMEKLYHRDAASKIRTEGYRLVNDPKPLRFVGPDRQIYKVDPANASAAFEQGGTLILKELSTSKPLNPEIAKAVVSDPESPFHNWFGPTPKEPEKLKRWDTYTKLLEKNRKGRAGFLEGINPFDLSVVPWLGSAADTVDAGRVYLTAQKLRDGKEVSDQDVLDLNIYLTEIERTSNANWLGKVGRVMRDSTTFGVEIGSGIAFAAFTGAMGSPAVAAALARKAGGKVIREGIEEVVEKAAKTATQKKLAAASTEFLKDRTTGNLFKLVTTRGFVSQSVVPAAKEWAHLALGASAPKLAAGTANLTFAQKAGGAIAGMSAFALPPTIFQTGTQALSSLAAGQDPGTLRGKQDLLFKALMGEDTEAASGFWYGLGDQLIENFSEAMGGYLTGGLSKLAGGMKLGGQKVGQWLDDAIGQSVGAPNIPALATKARALTAFARFTGEKMKNLKLSYGDTMMLFKDMGYNGVIGEMLEERAGDFMRGLFGMEGDDADNMIERAFKNIWPGLEQLSVEAAAFSAPLAFSIATPMALGAKMNDRIRAIRDISQAAYLGGNKTQEILDLNVGFDRPTKETLTPGLTSLYKEQREYDKGDKVQQTGYKVINKLLDHFGFQYIPAEGDKPGHFAQNVSDRLMFTQSAPVTIFMEQAVAAERTRLSDRGEELTEARELEVATEAGLQTLAELNNALILHSQHPDGNIDDATMAKALTPGMVNYLRQIGILERDEQEQRWYMHDISKLSDTQMEVVFKDREAIKLKVDEMTGAKATEANWTSEREKELQEAQRRLQVLRKVTAEQEGVVTTEGPGQATKSFEMGAEDVADLRVAGIFLRERIDSEGNPRGRITFRNPNSRYMFIDPLPKASGVARLTPPTEDEQIFETLLDTDTTANLTPAQRDRFVRIIGLSGVLDTPDLDKIWQRDFAGTRDQYRRRKAGQLAFAGEDLVDNRTGEIFTLDSYNSRMEMVLKSKDNPNAVEVPKSVEQLGKDYTVVPRDTQYAYGVPQDQDLTGALKIPYGVRYFSGTMEEVYDKLVEMQYLGNKKPEELPDNATLAQKASHKVRMERYEKSPKKPGPAPVAPAADAPAKEKAAYEVERRKYLSAHKAYYRRDALSRMAYKTDRYADEAKTKPVWAFRLGGERYRGTGLISLYAPAQIGMGGIYELEEILETWAADPVLEKERDGKPGFDLLDALNEAIGKLESLASNKDTPSKEKKEIRDMLAAMPVPGDPSASTEYFSKVALYLVGGHMKNPVAPFTPWYGWLDMLQTKGGLTDEKLAPFKAQLERNFGKDRIESLMFKPEAVVSKEVDAKHVSDKAARAQAAEQKKLDEAEAEKLSKKERGEGAPAPAPKAPTPVATRAESIQRAADMVEQRRADAAEALADAAVRAAEEAAKDPFASVPYEMPKPARDKAAELGITAEDIIASGNTGSAFKSAKGGRRYQEKHIVEIAEWKKARDAEAAADKAADPTGTAPTGTTPTGTTPIGRVELVWKHLRDTVTGDKYLSDSEKREIQQYIRKGMEDLGWDQQRVVDAVKQKFNLVIPFNPEAEKAEADARQRESASPPKAASEDKASDQQPGSKKPAEKKAAADGKQPSDNAPVDQAPPVDAGAKPPTPEKVEGSARRTRNRFKGPPTSGAVAANLPRPAPVKRAAGSAPPEDPKLTRVTQQLVSSLNVVLDALAVAGAIPDAMVSDKLVEFVSAQQTVDPSTARRMLESYFDSQDSVADEQVSQKPVLEMPEDTSTGEDAVTGSAFADAFNAAFAKSDENVQTQQYAGGLKREERKFSELTKLLNVIFSATYGESDIRPRLLENLAYSNLPVWKELAGPQHGVQLPSFLHSRKQFYEWANAVTFDVADFADRRYNDETIGELFKFILAQLPYEYVKELYKVLSFVPYDVTSVSFGQEGRAFSRLLNANSNAMIYDAFRRFQSDLVPGSKLSNTIFDLIGAVEQGRGNRHFERALQDAAEANAAKTATPEQRKFLADSVKLLSLLTFGAESFVFESSTRDSLVREKGQTSLQGRKADSFFAIRDAWADGKISKFAAAQTQEERDAALPELKRQLFAMLGENDFSVGLGGVPLGSERNIPDKAPLLKLAVASANLSGNASMGRGMLGNYLGPRSPHAMSQALRAMKRRGRVEGMDAIVEVYDGRRGDSAETVDASTLSAAQREEVIRELNREAFNRQGYDGVGRSAPLFVGGKDQLYALKLKFSKFYTREKFESFATADEFLADFLGPNGPAEQVWREMYGEAFGSLAAFESANEMFPTARAAREAFLKRMDQATTTSIPEFLSAPGALPEGYVVDMPDGTKGFRTLVLEPGQTNKAGFGDGAWLWGVLDHFIKTGRFPTGTQTTKHLIAGAANGRPILLKGAAFAPEVFYDQVFLSPGAENEVSMGEFARAAAKAMRKQKAISFHTPSTAKLIFIPENAPRVAVEAVNGNGDKVTLYAREVVIPESTLGRIMDFPTDAKAYSSHYIKQSFSGVAGQLMAVMGQEAWADLNTMLDMEMAALEERLADLPASIDREEFARSLERRNPQLARFVRNGVALDNPWIADEASRFLIDQTAHKIGAGMPMHKSIGVDTPNAASGTGESSPAEYSVNPDGQVAFADSSNLVALIPAGKTKRNGRDIFRSESVRVGIPASWRWSPQFHFDQMRKQSIWTEAGVQSAIDAELDAAPGRLGIPKAKFNRARFAQTLHSVFDPFRKHTFIPQDGSTPFGKNWEEASKYIAYLQQQYGVLVDMADFADGMPQLETQAFTGVHVRPEYYDAPGGIVLPGLHGIFIRTPSVGGSQSTIPFVVADVYESAMFEVTRTTGELRGSDFDGDTSGHFFPPLAFAAGIRNGYDKMDSSVTQLGAHSEPAKFLAADSVADFLTKRKQDPDAKWLDSGTPISSEAFRVPAAQAVINSRSGIGNVAVAYSGLAYLIDALRPGPSIKLGTFEQDAYGLPAYTLSSTPDAHSPWTQWLYKAMYDMGQVVVDGGKTPEENALLAFTPETISVFAAGIAVMQTPTEAPSPGGAYDFVLRNGLLPLSSFFGAHPLGKKIVEVLRREFYEGQGEREFGVSVGAFAADQLLNEQFLALSETVTTEEEKKEAAAALELATNKYAEYLPAVEYLLGLSQETREFSNVLRFATKVPTEGVAGLDRFLRLSEKLLDGEVDPTRLGGRAGNDKLKYITPLRQLDESHPARKSIEYAQAALLKAAERVRNTEVDVLRNSEWFNQLHRMSVPAMDRELKQGRDNPGTKPGWAMLSTILGGQRNKQKQLLPPTVTVKPAYRNVFNRALRDAMSVMAFATMRQSAGAPAQLRTEELIKQVVSEARRLQATPEFAGNRALNNLIAAIFVSAKGGKATGIRRTFRLSQNFFQLENPDGSEAAMTASWEALPMPFQINVADLFTRAIGTLQSRDRFAQTLPLSFVKQFDAAYAQAREYLESFERWTQGSSPEQNAISSLMLNTVAQLMLFKDQELQGLPAVPGAYVAPEQAAAAKVGFEVKPMDKVPAAEKKKAPFKASLSTKYIGVGPGSTGLYREQVRAQGVPTNVADYSPSDVVFTSVNGSPAPAALNETIRLVRQALDAGATVLTDSEKYLATSTYNNGERALAKSLLDAGYVRTPHPGMPDLVAQWRKAEVAPASVAPSASATEAQGGPATSAAVAAVTTVSDLGKEIALLTGTENDKTAPEYEGDHWVERVEYVDPGSVALRLYNSAAKRLVPPGGVNLDPRKIRTVFAQAFGREFDGQMEVLTDAIGSSVWLEQQLLIGLEAIVQANDTGSELLRQAESNPQGPEARAINLANAALTKIRGAETSAAIAASPKQALAWAANRYARQNMEVPEGTPVIRKGMTPWQRKRAQDLMRQFNARWGQLAEQIEGILNEDGRPVQDKVASVEAFIADRKAANKWPQGPGGAAFERNLRAMLAANYAGREREADLAGIGEQAMLAEMQETVQGEVERGADREGLRDLGYSAAIANPIPELPSEIFGGAVQPPPPLNVTPARAPKRQYAGKPMAADTEAQGIRVVQGPLGYDLAAKSISVPSEAMVPAALAAYTTAALSDGVSMLSEPLSGTEPYIRSLDARLVKAATGKPLSDLITREVSNLLHGSRSLFPLEQDNPVAVLSQQIASEIQGGYTNRLLSEGRIARTAKGPKLSYGEPRNPTPENNVFKFIEFMQQGDKVTKEQAAELAAAFSRSPAEAIKVLDRQEAEGKFDDYGTDFLALRDAFSNVPSAFFTNQGMTPSEAADMSAAVAAMIPFADSRLALLKRSGIPGWHHLHNEMANAAHAAQGDESNWQTYWNAVFGDGSAKVPIWDAEKDNGPGLPKGGWEGTFTVHGFAITAREMQERENMLRMVAGSLEVRDREWNSPRWRAHQTVLGQFQYEYDQNGKVKLDAEGRPVAIPTKDGLITLGELHDRWEASSFKQRLLKEGKRTAEQMDLAKFSEMIGERWDNDYAELNRNGWIFNGKEFIEYRRNYLASNYRYGGSDNPVLHHSMSVLFKKIRAANPSNSLFAINKNGIDSAELAAIEWSVTRRGEELPPAATLAQKALIRRIYSAEEIAKFPTNPETGELELNVVSANRLIEKRLHATLLESMRRYYDANPEALGVNDWTPGGQAVLYVKDGSPVTLPGVTESELIATLRHLQDLNDKVKFVTEAPALRPKFYATWADAYKTSRAENPNNPAAWLLPDTGDIMKVRSRYVFETYTAMLNRTAMAGFMTIHDVNGTPMMLVKPASLEAIENGVISKAAWLEAAGIWSRYAGLIEPFDARAPDLLKEIQRVYEAAALKFPKDRILTSAKTPGISEYRVGTRSAQHLINKLIQVPFTETHEWAKAAMKVVQATKLMSVGFSMFFYVALMESSISASGIRRNLLWQSIFDRAEFKKFVRGVKQYRLAQRYYNPVIAARARRMMELGLKTRTPSQILDPVSGIVYETMEKWAENGADMWGNKRGEQLRTMLLGSKINTGGAAGGIAAMWPGITGKKLTDFMFGWFSALKEFQAEYIMMNAATDVGYNADSALLVPRRIARPAVQFANETLGGPDWNMFTWSTPNALAGMGMGLFAPAWTVSNIMSAGMGSIPFLQKTFGSYYAPGEWPMIAASLVSMYIVVMKVIPAAMQGAFWAAGMALGAGDPDDTPFPWMNETGRENHIDVTPLMRASPWYKGDPTGNRRMYIQFGKQIHETGILNPGGTRGWVNEPGNQLLRKLSMPAKYVLELMTGTSPGSGGWDLEFKDKGMLGWINSGEPGFKGLWTSRLGYGAQKLVPLSFTTFFANPEVLPLNFIAPVSKGASQTKMVDAMVQVLSTYASAEDWRRIRQVPRARAALESLVPEVMEAARLNGYEPAKVLQTAKGIVLGKLYDDMWKALDREDEAEINKAAASIFRVWGTTQGLKNSLSNKSRAYNKETTDEQKQMALDALEIAYNGQW